MKTVRDWMCRTAAIVWLAAGDGMPPAQAQTPAAGAAADAPAVAPHVPDDSETRWETQSVRELMQQDLRAALQTAPDGASGALASGTGVRPVLAPRLVALYGVGQALMAEVQVGHQAYLYVRGQAWPAGHTGDRGVYQLRGMNGACIQLERGE